VPSFRRPRFPVLTARRVAAGLLAAAALWFAVQPDADVATAEPELVPVAVAATELAAGTVLAADDVRTASFPESLVPAGAGAGGRVTGRVLAGAVRAGEPITDARLVGPGLTAHLPPDQVAAPVRLADLAVAALARAGDRVDVLAALPDGAPAETVADGALLLAVPGGDTESGLLLLAVDRVTAARLAAAATTATLTVTLVPP
jgi:Flp pilus assembly protein CpaB